MTSKPKCKKWVNGEKPWHRCNFNSVNGDWCKVHHPDAIAKRQAEKMERWQAKRQTMPLYSQRFVDSLEKRIKKLEAELEKSRDYYMAGFR